MQPQTRPSGWDDATIAELYQRHAHTLLAFIRRYVSTREDAEDALLEVFMAAFEQNVLADLSDNAQLAWLRRVARNKCVDIYRRAQRRPFVSLEDVADLIDDEEHSPEQLALCAEEHALLRAQLSNLPELQQEILRLRFADGLRSAEIARMFNKREGTIRMLISRALNLLRGLYEQQSESERV